MDPNALWKVLCELLRELEHYPHNYDLRVQVSEMLENLAQWLRNGGFPPTLGD